MSTIVITTLNDKVKSILAQLQMTPSHFADEIGVQRSSISHILSGRNRPSLEIIQKVVTRFPEFTYEWLLEQTQEESTPTSTYDIRQPNRPAFSRVVNKKGGSLEVSDLHASATLGEKENSRVIEKILIFFNDKTFTEYRPG